jgi:hypothetical protein
MSLKSWLEGVPRAAIKVRLRQAETRLFGGAELEGSGFKSAVVSKVKVRSSLKAPITESDRKKNK